MLAALGELGKCRYLSSTASFPFGDEAVFCVGVLAVWAASCAFRSFMWALPAKKRVWPVALATEPVP